VSAAHAIRVEGLGKQYVIGRSAPDRHLRDRIVSEVASTARRFRAALAGSSRPDEAPTIWALREVSFDVAPGEVVGVVGGNGAGKSTLLKILSRITPPTEGRVEMHGRIGSLLEVGTGFHPDLTGRENVFMNGAILGMRRDEIRRKFDAIVEFAEVDTFIDTPVKYYSSGMYVRLAFAVAAHLEPEILVVDEVLAVGDVRFQRKCLGKMDEVARGGRTVLFVSHNMAAVQRLCSSALLLDRGRIVFRGEPRAAVARYLGGESRNRFEAPARTGQPQVVEAELVDPRTLAPLSRPVITDPIGIRLRVVLPERSPGLRCGIGVLAADAVPLFTSNLDDVGQTLPPGPGEYLVTATLPAGVLLAGDYHVATCLWHEQDVVDLQEPALSFSTEAGASELYQRDGDRKGYVQVPCSWDVSC
jgi:lipopolysaccharide transport system ATP-binding protein